MAIVTGYRVWGPVYDRHALTQIVRTLQIEHEVRVERDGDRWVIYLKEPVT